MPSDFIANNNEARKNARKENLRDHNIMVKERRHAQCTLYCISVDTEVFGLSSFFTFF